MPLTYQPFADAPSILELSRDLHMNVGDPERIVSGFVGSALVAAAISRRGVTGGLLLAAGAALIGRAWTGRCAYYRSAGIDHRHPADRKPESGSKDSSASRRGLPNPPQINFEEDPELRYSAEELNLTPEQLGEALKNVEPIAEERSPTGGHSGV